MCKPSIEYLECSLITLFQLLFQFLINIVKKIISDSTFTFWVEIQPSDVQAIHRIPGKDGFQKPVIVKVRNTDVKIQIMRQKKNLIKKKKKHFP
jgi:hypothetical protein